MSSVDVVDAKWNISRQENTVIACLLQAREGVKGKMESANNLYREMKKYPTALKKSDRDSLVKMWFRVSVCHITITYKNINCTLIIVLFSSIHAQAGSCCQECFSVIRSRILNKCYRPASHDIWTTVSAPHSTSLDLDCVHALQIDVLNLLMLFWFATNQTVSLFFAPISCLHLKKERCCSAV